MTEQTDAVIRRLSAQLEAVSPVARLRVTGALAGLAAFAFGAAVVAFNGARGDLGTTELPPFFTPVAVCLLLICVGAMVAALAGSLPGRELAENSALAIAGLGATGTCVSLLLTSPAAFEAAELGTVLPCSGSAAIFGVPILACLLHFVRKGVALHPGRGLNLAWASAVAAAAGAVHLTCASNDSLHLILGHGMAPLSAGAPLLAATLLLGWMRRAGGSAAS